MLAALGLAACMPSEPLSGSASGAAVSEAAPEALAGQYRVAGIDGEEVSGGIGIALTITDAMIWFEPRCAGFSWTYSYADGALATDRPEKPRSDDAPYVAQRMRPTCRIAVHPEQRRLADALDGVIEARRTPSNGIELRGEEHSVLLYTQ
jgi:hypothetical protein